MVKRTEPVLVDEVPNWDTPLGGIVEEKKEEKIRQLNSMEEKEYREGQALKEMVETSEGWRLIKKDLEALAFHSWIDPRTIDKPGGLTKDEWEFRELNAFHAANNAKELLENINKKIERSEYLGAVKRGEIVTKGFKI